MGLLNKIFGKEKKQESIKIEELKEIGEVDCCPYCKHKLEKIPARKKKCLFCSNFIYSRKRPVDQKKVLLTQEDAKEVEKQWQIANGTREYHIEEEKNYESMRDVLRKRFGKEPSDHDIKWGLFNNNLIEHASTKQWGLYRNDKFAMGELLRKEKKFKQALTFFLQVVYLDINGAENTHPDLVMQEFDPKNGFIALGIIEKIDTIMRKLKISTKELEDLFVKTNDQTKPKKKMPISPKQAWKKIIKELY